MDAVLLCNLGSPSSTRVTDVRAYLREFLMDPLVLQMPRLVRWMLVNLVILPIRPRRTAEAYASIWSPQGPPLVTHSRTLAGVLENTLERPVAIGMRYGSPSIAEGLERLANQGATRVRLAPLYPQFADSTTTTCVQEAKIQAAQLGIDIEIIPPFYSDEAWLNAVAESIRRAIPEQSECLLLSYHGLPEAHIVRRDPTGNTCLAQDNCCSAPGAAAATCYRHQCLVSGQQIAKRLDLTSDQCRISFQSRLGRAKWLLPATDQILGALPGEGIKHLTVACPGFTADNLETLEEIGIRGKQLFLSAGGTSFTLVPCLNDDANWVRAIAELILRPQDEQQIAGVDLLTR